MQNIYVKGQEFENIKEVHEWLAEQLSFPAYYGKNLSALYDVLTDLCEDTRIEVDLRGIVDDTLAEQIERMAEVMSDAADANQSLEVSIVC
jgi:ribonuclease inhibitor